MCTKAVNTPIPLGLQSSTVRTSLLTVARPVGSCQEAFMTPALPPYFKTSGRYQGFTKPF